MAPEEDHVVDGTDRELSAARNARRNASEVDMDILASGYRLIEAPVWVAGRGLYFSDVLGGGVYLL